MTPYADLQVASVTVPATAIAGEQATFSWTITNAGNGATDAAAWTDSLYLSTDKNLDGSDVHVGSAQNPSYLAAGESYAQSLTADIRSDLSGHYYLLVVTDASSQQYEHLFEGNNTDSSTTTMQVEAPAVPGFLHVSSVTVSPSVTSRSSPASAVRSTPATSIRLST